VTDLEKAADELIAAVLTFEYELGHAVREQLDYPETRDLLRTARRYRWEKRRARDAKPVANPERPDVVSRGLATSVSVDVPGRGPCKLSLNDVLALWASPPSMLPDTFPPTELHAGWDERLSARGFIEPSNSGSGWTRWSRTPLGNEVAEAFMKQKRAWGEILL
jgi:hypothetical protein